MAGRRSRPKLPRPRSWRRALDEWFPTIVRYFGLALMGYWVAIDHLHHAALFTAATGCILFKTVYGGGGRD